MLKNNALLFTEFVMNVFARDNFKFKDKTKLVKKVNYSASAMALLFGIVCYFLLDVKVVIPYIFWLFSLINAFNTFLMDRHEKFVLTYNITSILAMISAMAITLFSGGIQSPFIYVLGIVVFAGYVTTEVYGKIYLTINILVVVLIFLHDLGDFDLVVNVVPDAAKNWFAFLSVVLAVYLLGGVFGKNLLEAHHRLYKSQKEIENRINEKETLLKEVHHRVKNNLQTVSSLLSLQSRSLEDVKISRIIKSSQNRVVSMAMVHEMLYKRDDYLSKIEFRPYVQELCEYLIRSIGTNSEDVELDIDVPDIKLSIDTVIPLGLIINETVTNALKYAFPNEKKGKILIRVRTLENNMYELYIGDNGIGFSEDVNPKNTKSLGLKLIHNLSRQLRGTIARDMEQKGTYYKITFQEIIEDFKSVEE